MIITVTLNPAIDKTIDVGHMEVGGLNRIQSGVRDVGGKGINVSKTIKALGGNTIATGFVAGSTGEHISSTLKGLDIQTDFVWVDGETRTNTKVYSENYGITELNEQGAEITTEQLAALLQKLEGYAKPDTIFVLAGSAPAGVPKDIYNTICTMVREKGGRVILDADGELFEKSLPSVPHIMKPNREEVAQYMGISGEMTKEQLMNTTFLEKGSELVAISMGGDGALFLTSENKYFCKGLKVSVKSTVGAGDAMVAALAYATEQKMDLENTIKLAVATSAGAVTTIGTKPPTLEVVQELQKQVVLEKI
ncbi:MAG: 1-phosphofructokinase [Eubacteriales bacterium]